MSWHILPYPTGLYPRPGRYLLTYLYQFPHPHTCSAAILGVIPRKCPREPLAELFWDLQTCDSDRDCWPRVCCPDGARKYCRTAQPELDKSTLSVARQLSTREFRIKRLQRMTVHGLIVNNIVKLWSRYRATSSALRRRRPSSTSFRKSATAR